MSTRISRKDAKSQRHNPFSRPACRARPGRSAAPRAVQARRLNSPAAYRLPPSPFAPLRLCVKHRVKRGFTLVELLVTVTIIAILAGVVLAALNAARQTARQAKTKATIAKLDQVIMRRYDSYMTRRVPISTSGMNPYDAAEARLDAIRDLMRMEMPERWNDINNPPISFPWGSVPQPAVHCIYYQQYNTAFTRYGANLVARFGPAECLYMIVSTCGGDAMENFSQSEIGDIDGDGLPEFLDGWGHPIMFLRWAPGFTGESAVQIGCPITSHDPFDARNIDDGQNTFYGGTDIRPNAYHLIPLIYSAGPDGKIVVDDNGIPQLQGLGLVIDDENITNGYFYGIHLSPPEPFSPYARNSLIGAPDGTGDHYDNIHNHRIEAR